MARLEEAAADAGQLGQPDLAIWQAVLEHVGPLLPDGRESDGASHRDLSDDATGIQISLAPGELSLTIPYRYQGPDAQEMVDRLRMIAATIESATGLVAYDPQADAPFLNGGALTAAAAFDQAAAVLSRPFAPDPDQTRPDRSRRFKRLFRTVADQPPWLIRVHGAKAGMGQARSRR